MRPQVNEKLAREYDDERRRIEHTIQVIQLDRKDYVANLDAALVIIAEIADRYVLHTSERQGDILKQMVSRVVINLEGRIIRIELKQPFNYLVNGVWSPIDELTPDDWRHTVDINLNGTFYTIKYAASHLKANGGSIIITSSVNGTQVFNKAGDPKESDL
jgi:NAD(P)-dependent dehydrogenase (short-subunit alcohol dehydrogenase family)